MTYSGISLRGNSLCIHRNSQQKLIHYRFINFVSETFPNKKLSWIMARSDKEAVIIIFDIGLDSQASENSKDGESFFAKAKSCISKIIQRKIFCKEKDEIGMILMGTDESNNNLHKELGSYENISEAFELQTGNWQMLRILDKEVQTRKNRADWLDALIVAMDFMKRSIVGKKFSDYKIILLSPFVSSVNDENVDIVIDGMTKMNINLVVINDNVEYKKVSDNTTDLEDNPIFSQKHTKSQDQIESEELVMKIIEGTEGTLCNLEYAELQLLYFEKQSTRPMPWNCDLTIGTELKIKISAYIMVKENNTISSFKTEGPYPEVSVKTKTEYFMNEKPIELDLDNMIKGYMYGSTVVPYDTAFNVDYNIGEKCLMCIGFTNMKYINPHHMSTAGTSIIVPQKNSPASAKMFAALVASMQKMNVGMVVRRVYNRACKPRINVLLPSRDFQNPTLIMRELGFAEDKMYLTFSSMQAKKNDSTPEQLEAIEQLIDDMDLMDALDDDSGLHEAFDIHKMLNPIHQHIYRSIAHRALVPKETIPAISQELVDMVQVPLKVQQRSKTSLEKVKSLYELQVIQKPSKILWLQKNLKKTASDDAVGDKNGDILDDIDNSENSNIVAVGTVTPAEDFANLLRRGERFATLCQQIQVVINDLVCKSMTPQTEKVAMALVIYREEAKILGSFHYNQWIVEFKNTLLSRNKIEVWDDIIIKHALGLISAEESETSTVTPEEVEEFYKFRKALNTTSDGTHPIDDVDVDDLFGAM